MTIPALHTLANGIRVLTLPMQHVQSASVGIFVNTGSRNEIPETNGISHFLEHMAFKGTTTRDVQKINMDAERLGASFNAFTSKETTAYFMTGLGKHSPQFLEMLADIVCNSSFPEDEIERERSIILQEALEYAEDPGSIVDVLLDQATFHQQAMGMQVIGTSANIHGFKRQDLVDYVTSQYTGDNIVVAAAGKIDPDLINRLSESLLMGLPAGTRHVVATPKHRGGIRTQKIAGVSQVFVKIGFPVSSMSMGHHRPSVLAAALFGAGMSSPLVNEIRERQGLAYSVGSSIDIGDNYGTFIIDALTTPRHLPQLMESTAQLLRQHAHSIDLEQLERARNQLAVEFVTSNESPFSLMERAVEHQLVHGRNVPDEEVLDSLESITATDVRLVFERMLEEQPSMSIVGKSDSKAFFKAFVAALA